MALDHLESQLFQIMSRSFQRYNPHIVHHNRIRYVSARDPRFPVKQFRKQAQNML
jgi:hypothetical protein